MMNIFNIDPQFSVYRLVKRSMKDAALMHHRRTMTVISHEIENATLVDGTKTVVFAAFQRMSRFLPQVKRYERMAKTATTIFVFGIPDVKVPAIPNIVYVPLKPTDQLAKEWFLVSYGEDYFSALATEELTHIDDPDDTRLFKGYWTFDPFIVEILQEWLCNIVGLRFEQRPNQHNNHQRQSELVTNAIGRITVRIMDQNRYDTEFVRKELQQIVQYGLYPVIQNIKKLPQTGTLRYPNDVVRR